MCVVKRVRMRGGHWRRRMEGEEALRLPLLGGEGRRWRKGGLVESDAFSQPMQPHHHQHHTANKAHLAVYHAVCVLMLERREGRVATIASLPPLHRTCSRRKRAKKESMPAAAAVVGAPVVIMEKDNGAVTASNVTAAAAAAAAAPASAKKDKKKDKKKEKDAGGKSEDAQEEEVEEEVGKDDAKDRRTIFVGNLPTSINKKRVQSLFKEYGEIGKYIL